MSIAEPRRIVLFALLASLSVIAVYRIAFQIPFSIVAG